MEELEVTIARVCTPDNRYSGLHTNNYVIEANFGQNWSKNFQGGNAPRAPWDGSVLS